MKMNFKFLLSVSMIASSTMLASINLYAAESSVPIYGTPPVSTSQQQVSVPNRANKEKAASKLSAKPKEVARPVPPPSKVTLNFVEAFKAGNMDMAKMHLQNGADINCRNCFANGETALFYTYYPLRGHRGHDLNPRTVWLLENGADPNIPDNSGRTLLMHLATDQVTNPFYSGIEDFEYLLRKGANVKLKDNLGSTALHYLAYNAPSDPKVLSDRGWGDSAFDMAKQWMRAFEGLIAAGADINAMNKGGDTPLMFIAGKCNPHFLETLLNYGADPSLKNKVGQSPLQIAIDVASRNNSQACNRVVEILQSSPVARAKQPVSTTGKNTHTQQVVEDTSEWVGLFRATIPRRGDANVTVRIAPSGSLTFNSSSGLRGSGEMSLHEGRVTAMVKAISPTNANGKPVFGANEIIFDMIGRLENGVIHGEYKSVVESGTFILCSPEARQNRNDCDSSPVGNPLSGLLDVLRTLSVK